MKKSMIVVFTLAVATAAAIALRRDTDTTLPVQRKTAAWKPFGYQLRPVRNASRFDLCFRFTDADGGSTVRALVDCLDDSNYYYVQFADDEVRLSRVEQSLDLPIGTRRRTALNDGQPHDVVIKRRDGLLSVVVDGRLTAHAFDDTFAAGQVGLGRTDESVQFTNFKLQPVGGVFFTDDFTRDETDPGPWEPASGAWRGRSLAVPSLSSNAFYFAGKASAGERAEPGRCLTGHWFWDNYRFRASCRPNSDAAFGICFCYRDRDRYFLLRWSGKPAPRIELVRREGGRDEVLAHAPSAFMPRQWYGLRVDVSDGHAEVYVDGNLMVTVSDPGLCFGKVGLYTEDASEGTHFDDVSVKSWRRFADDFEREAVGQWTELGGLWEWVTAQGEGASQRVVASCGKMAKAVAGRHDWTNYTFAVDIGPWTEGEAGLCFHYLDEGNYYACRWRRTERGEVGELLKTVNGVVSVLAQQDGALRQEAMRVAARANDGYIRVDVDGKPALEAFDPDLRTGKVGLYVRNCPSVWFDNVQVDFHTPAEPLESVHEAFSHEESMQVWSGAESDWEQRHHEDTTRTVNWHRADFRGDVRIEFSVASLADGANMVGLVAGADDVGEGPGYRLEAVKAESDSMWELTLYDGARVVGERALKAGREPCRFSLRKAGRFVAAYVDGRCLLWGQSEAARPGTRIGYFARGAEVDDVRIYTQHVYNDLFCTAPAQWRIACGRWEVTNRWQCDPRWSFFAGMSEGLAAIWSKRQFTGDITVEFFAGIRMDRNRGRRYEYASDMNVTICADGQDLNSGYSFLFGGWRNTASAIVRKGRVVKRTRSHTIPSEKSTHRRWFHIRAEKRGADLAFYIDGQQALVYTDPEPLPGGQVAMWTYNNGLMVSRVRISYDGEARLERPRMLPSTAPRCVYDCVSSLRR